MPSKLIHSKSDHNTLLVSVSNLSLIPHPCKHGVEIIFQATADSNAISFFDPLTHQLIIHAYGKEMIDTLSQALAYASAQLKERTTNT